jgi:hypothetical protein
MTHETLRISCHISAIALRDLETVTIKDSDYATLMWFDRIRELPPIDCDKRDRRDWVVINHATEQLSLFFQ